MIRDFISTSFNDLPAKAFACSSYLSHVPLLSGYDEPRTLSYQIRLIGSDLRLVEGCLGFVRVNYPSGHDAGLCKAATQPLRA